MKKRKPISIFLLVAMLCASQLFAIPVRADSKPTKISASGSKTRSVKVGAEFKLRVNANGDDDYLHWSITGTKGIVAFEDDDRDDDDVEMHALKKGTTKVTCKIKNTSKKVTFTVKVTKATYDAKKQGISHGTAASVSMSVGQERELKIKKASSAVKDNTLKWTISAGKGVVAFDDDDIYDNDIEIVALKTGSASVTCQHMLTGKKVTFSVTVTNANTQHDDDDDHDDD